MACRARWPCWRRTPTWPASRSWRSSMAGRRPRTTPRDSAPRACRSTTCGSPRAPTTWITARACGTQLVAEQAGAVAERAGLAGMAEPRPDPRRRAQRGLGVRELAREAVRRAENVARRGHARVLAAERALPDLQRAREQPLGL